MPLNKETLFQKGTTLEVLVLLMNYIVPRLLRS